MTSQATLSMMAILNPRCSLIPRRASWIILAFWRVGTSLRDHWGEDVFVVFGLVVSKLVAGSLKGESDIFSVLSEGVSMTARHETLDSHGYPMDVHGIGIFHLRTW